MAKFVGNFNYRKLKQRMAATHLSFAEIARESEIDANVLQRILDNEAEFDQDQIIRLARLLEIEDGAISQYFFDLEVRKSEQ